MNSALISDSSAGGCQGGTRCGKFLARCRRGIAGILWGRTDCLGRWLHLGDEGEEEGCGEAFGGVHWVLLFIVDGNGEVLGLLGYYVSLV